MFHSIQALQELFSLSAHPCNQSFIDERNQLFKHLTSLHSAAVLIAFAPDKQGKWHILMTQRTPHLRQHSGQIAFPGGKNEPGETFHQTALRETFEETGIEPHSWQVFSALPELITPSAYRITPIPAVCTFQPTASPNPNEVATLFWLPIEIALRPDCYQWSQLEYQNQSCPAPALQYGQYYIWGATAFLLYHLANCAAMLKTT